MPSWLPLSEQRFPFARQDLAAIRRLPSLEAREGPALTRRSKAAGLPCRSSRPQGPRAEPSDGPLRVGRDLKRSYGSIFGVSANLRATAEEIIKPKRLRQG